MRRSRWSQASRERVSVNQTCRQLTCNLMSTVGGIVKKRGDDSSCLGKKGFWRKLQRKSGFGVRP